ncbi:hypothetical protein NDA01_28040 [Trichocoleus desertorum AS-A10]|uniref:hypothetical protein n=1 Tax=Trichocoleus desertorum TaxID=1481672 RepID=UPI003297FADF
MSIINRQQQLIDQLQDQLEQRGTLKIFPEGVPEVESLALALLRAIAGLKELLSIPMVRESGNLTIVGNEVEHVFDSETYKLLRDVVNIGLESPDQAQYQLNLIARILGINGNQTELGQAE